MFVFNKKKCPYCGERIDKNAQKCPFCAEKVNETVDKYRETKTLSIPIIDRTQKKQFLITISSLILFMAISYFLKVYFYCSEYKSIEKFVKNNNFTEVTFTSYEVVNLANQQQKDLLEFLKSNAPQSRKDAVFITFFDNLKYYRRLIEIKTNVSYENKKLFKGEIDTIDGLTLKSTGKKWYNDTPKGIAILEPKTSLFFYKDDCEGFFSPSINMTYLKNTFGKYLSHQYNNYLSIRSKEEKLLNGFGLYQDGYLTIRPLEMLNLTLAWQNYLKEYPKFHYRQEIENTIKNYTRHILLGDQSTYDSETQKITPEAKKAMEDYLANANKNTKAYANVQRKYNWLKENNFMFSTEEEPDYDFENNKNNNESVITDTGSIDYYYYSAGGEY